MTDEKENDWNQWAKYVLEELKRLNVINQDVSRDLKNTETRIQERLMSVQLELNSLKIKAAVLGAIVGASTGVVGSQLVRALFNP